MDPCWLGRIAVFLGAPDPQNVFHPTRDPGPPGIDRHVRVPLASTDPNNRLYRLSRRRKNVHYPLSSPPAAQRLPRRPPQE